MDVKKIFHTFVFGFFLLVIAGFSGGLGVASVVVYQVFWGDHSALKKTTILARINEETTIYTLDGKTRIGAFFNNSHRTYVPIEEVPAHMLRAMVASEDKNFYNHYGIDPIAISSAFWDGVRRGFRFRRGGSTITQQTVKNIMDRREHTFQRKFKEMIRALQLERLYTKNEILEFYLNQFHVTANGNGIGIAAKYYFNKSVEDLSLVEAAFISGSVKAPDKYNPFTKYTKEKRALAWQRADERKNYVLRRMYEQGWISEEELKVGWETTVPFSKGKFTSKEVALVQLIKGQLDKKEILEALELDSIKDLNHAGLKIFTTIDAELQKQGQLAMRRNLSRLEYIIEDFKVEDPKRFKTLRSLEENQFAFGKVAKIHKGRKKDAYLEIDFGLPLGVASYDSLERTAKILNLPTYKGAPFHIKQILNTLKVGDVVLAEVLTYDKETQRAEIELKAYPKVNGGMIAVEQGEVRAVVSGFEAKGFNRAVFARRQPGSTFKSLVYLAGLQMGWSLVDKLDNERRLFPFQGHFYYPRPDHASPYENVSMVWAGTKSENVASIYLAAHLLDKLNFGEFKKLLKHMNLMPNKGESVSDYHFRVSKAVGVQLNSDGIREHLLIKAIHDLKPDLVFSGDTKIFMTLSKLWWGQNYLPELKKLYDEEEEELKPKERAARVKMLFFSYHRLKRLSEELEKDWDALRELISSKGPETAFFDEATKEILERFRVLPGSSSRPSLAYFRFLPEEDAFMKENMEEIEVERKPPGRPLNALDMQMIWGESGGFGQANIPMSDVKLSGKVAQKYLPLIASNLENRHASVMALEEPYGIYRYFNHHDFRIVLGLKYLVSLSRAMGVYSDLEPVLSYPLGTNVVSVAEVAKIYQTFVDGKTYRFYEQGPQNQLNFIKRIEDREGNVLFEPEREEFQLFSPCLASQMAEILGKVVTHGTGRRARGELQIPIQEEDKERGLKEITMRVPAYGKTGTTNDYTTAYFAGFIPYPTVTRSPLALENSYVIASYVGYDLNETMRRGPYRISGAYGALPVWSDFGKALLEYKKYTEFVDKLDLSLYKKRVWPLSEHRCGEGMAVDLPRGSVLGKPEGILEVYKYTDFSREGEAFINEFARNASVQSILRIPMRGGLPKRQFELFAQPKEDDGSDEVEFSSENDRDQDGGAAVSGEKDDEDGVLDISLRRGEGSEGVKKSEDDGEVEDLNPLGLDVDEKKEGSKKGQGDSFTEDELW